MPASEFVKRRWINRVASGPVTSYLHVEKRSQIPVPVRIASYSSSTGVPSSIAQGNPSSQTISALWATCQSCSGERTSSVMRWLLPAARSDARTLFLGIVDRQDVDGTGDGARAGNDLNCRARDRQTDRNDR